MKNFEEQKHVYYERGLLYLLMEDERELLHKNTNVRATHAASELVTQAIKDFQSAIDLSLKIQPAPILSETGECVQLDPKIWIKAKMMLAYSRLRNN